MTFVLAMGHQLPSSNYICMSNFLRRKPMTRNHIYCFGYAVKFTNSNVEFQNLPEVTPPDPRFKVKGRGRERPLYFTLHRVNWFIGWLVGWLAGWLVGCLTARQQIKINLCQLRGRETGSSRIRMAINTGRTDEIESAVSSSNSVIWNSTHNYYIQSSQGEVQDSYQCQTPKRSSVIQTNDWKLHLPLKEFIIRWRLN